MTECPHGFEARYIDRCALCRRDAKKPATTPEIDNQRRAAGERDEDS